MLKVRRAALCTDGEYRTTGPLSCSLVTCIMGLKSYCNVQKCKTACKKLGMNHWVAFGFSLCPPKKKKIWEVVVMCGWTVLKLTQCL